VLRAEMAAGNCSGTSSRNARHGLGEALDHDPLVPALAREADRKGHAERVAAAPSGASGSGAGAGRGWWHTALSWWMPTDP
jgi:hypothetical protein